MAYRSDRQRVEAHLVPMLMLGVVIAGVNDPKHPDAVAAQQHLLDAANEAVLDLKEPERSKIIRRAHRTHEEITAPYYKEGHRVDKIGLIFFWIIKAITDCDYMVIGPESSLQQGLDLLLPALEHAAQVDPLMASAKRQGRKTLQHLQRLGYYSGVEFPA